MHPRNVVLLGVAALLAACSGTEPLDDVAATSLQYVSGGGTGVAGQPLAQEFVVKAVDQGGFPVPGLVVTWTVTAGGGSFAKSVDTTDAAGLASATLTLGTQENNAATASATGLASITFTATATGGTTDPTDPTDPTNPTDPTGLTFRTIDAGSYHTCAITRTEKAYCWGFNQEGQLGDGTTSSALVPTAVKGGITFRQISGGRYHSCGESFSGVGYCWGSNVDGRLGVGGYETPATEPSANAKAVALYYTGAGLVHTCALTFGGSAICWGYNGEGELGYVTDAASSDSAGFVRTAERFHQISVGGMHACGLVQTASEGGYAQGTALCWGYNDRGQLGNGTSTTISATWDTTVAAVTTVGGGMGMAFDSISAGYKHTCALTSGGQAWCWGDNTYGQLGDGGTTLRTSPVLVAGGLTFRQISAGYHHTCAVTTDGAAYCWGRNSPNAQQESEGGQLGDGTTTNRTAPVAVGGGLTFAQVSAGETTTCGVTTGDAAYCWGDNEYGQLGDNSRTSSAIPVKVAGQP
jgi:alpha-tubulin suppressor-like RCC1 family protein